MVSVVRALLEVDQQSRDRAAFAEFVDPLVVGLARLDLRLFWSKTKLGPGGPQPVLQDVPWRLCATLELIVLNHTVADEVSGCLSLCGNCCVVVDHRRPVKTQPALDFAQQ